MHTLTRKLFPLLTVLALIGSQLVAQSETAVTLEDFAEEEVYSPYAGRAYPDQVFFGDTHFHTEVSFDAGLVGTTLDIHDAFRFARGEKILSNTGQPVQLDSSARLPGDHRTRRIHDGLATGLRESSPTLLADPWGKSIYERFNSGPEGV